MTKDSFIYKPGKVIYKQGEPVYVQVDCDSVVFSKGGREMRHPSKVKIACPPCDSVKVDTVYISVRNTAVNKNKEEMQAAIIKNQDADIATLKERNRILLYFVIGLAAYTLLRWILRIWGVKLP